MTKKKNSLVSKYVNEFKEIHGETTDRETRARVFDIMTDLNDAKDELVTSKLSVDMAKEKIATLEKELKELE